MSKEIYFYNSSGARKRVKEAYFYDATGTQRYIKEGYFYDSAGNRKQFFQGPLLPTGYFPYSAPYGSPGTGGNGVTFSTPPCTFAAQGTFTFSGGTPLGTTVLMAHMVKQFGATGNNACWLVVSTPGPHPTIQDRRLWLNNVLCTLSGTPSLPFDYIGAGFGGYYYVTGAMNNAQSYLKAAPETNLFEIRDA